MLLENAPPPEKRLGSSDAFFFDCHRELACFNSCCRRKHLPLTPYDVLRLKTALEMHSDDFLGRYAVYGLDPLSGFPVISLKLRDDPELLCPFVTQNGCRVYLDRPTACRLYPLGRAAGRSEAQGFWEGFFFMLDAPGCLGMEQKKVRTILDWQERQGLAPYLEMNDRMLDIFFHPRRDRNSPLTERQLQKVMVAWYSLDVFREFVFNTSFFETFEIDEAIRSGIETDDVALLKLGQAYLLQTLF